MDNNYEMGLRKLDLIRAPSPQKVDICPPRRHFVAYLLVLGHTLHTKYREDPDYEDDITCHESI